MTEPTEGSGVVADGVWLSLSEVIARYRAAGYTESESTIRRELDEAIERGEVQAYRTRGQYRRPLASDVDAFIAVKGMSLGLARDRALAEFRRRNHGDERA